MPLRTDDIQLAENFHSREFMCPHCGKWKDNQPFRKFIKKLQIAREKAGVPFVINSGYRCEEYNIYINGALNSQHLTGAAADIATNNWTRLAIVKGLIKAELRIIIYSGHIHTDPLPAGILYGGESK